MVPKCPKCGSGNIKIVEYLGTNCLVCDKCGFDGRNELDVVPEEKKSQREKGRHTPYKAGGPSRSRK